MMNEKKPRGAEPSGAKGWTLYLLRCRDGSLYAGITVDPERRLAQHQDGTASRYTRSRRPVTMVYRESCASRSDALKREAAVKALSRPAKERLLRARPGADSITRRSWGRP
ncbi:MAG: GIY-YIG nuclease family protein [Nitrospirota bacterium]